MAESDADLDEERELEEAAELEDLAASGSLYAFEPTTQDFTQFLQKKHGVTLAQFAAKEAEAKK